MNPICERIQVIKCPKLEAPEFVQKAFLGITFFAFRREVAPYEAAELNDLKKLIPEAMFGYRAEKDVVYYALGKKSPEARKWLEDNNIPAWKHFFFKYPEECKIIPSFQVVE